MLIIHMIVERLTLAASNKKGLAFASVKVCESQLVLTRQFNP
jgi:hypothetical protein